MKDQTDNFIGSFYFNLFQNINICLSFRTFYTNLQFMDYLSIDFILNYPSVIKY